MKFIIAAFVGLIIVVGWVAYRQHQVSPRDAEHGARGGAYVVGYGGHVGFCETGQDCPGPQTGVYGTTFVMFHPKISGMAQDACVVNDRSFDVRQMYVHVEVCRALGLTKAAPPSPPEQP